MADGNGVQRPRREGRVELTWTNKDWRLLAREDGTWDWVPPTDYRVAEVRLLHEAAVVGDSSAGNLLIRGDSLYALRSLAELPRYANEYLGRVKLAYLDAPFNTRQTFEHYDDALEHSAWLTLMRDRLEQVRNLLASDGSVWVHCDDYEQHRARCVLDEVFGIGGFVATVLWQKRYSRDNRPAIGAVHDFIHVYALDADRWKEARNRVPRDAKTAKQYRNPNNDPDGPWRAIPMTAQGYRKNQMYEIVAPNGKVHRPSKGRCWGMLEPAFLELVEQDRIYWGVGGNAQPGVIKYLSEVEGLVPWTWWPHEEVGHNDEAKKEILALFPENEAFATPKPERLMRRIIGIGSNPGDIVLDCFLGSSTTTAVAQKMQRRWVGIEWSHGTVEEFAIPRMTKVVQGEDDQGVSEDEAWNGGGGFRVLDVGPSMFDEDHGQVLLADWATNGALAEATAAQLHFTFDLDSPFCARKGKTRLAVIDGHVSSQVVELLISQLDDAENMVVCGTSIDPQATETARELRSGSRVRKIPDSLLADYQTARWRPRPYDAAPEPAAESVAETVT